jgi:hypothetical protein
VICEPLQLRSRLRHHANKPQQTVRHPSTDYDRHNSELLLHPNPCSRSFRLQNGKVNLSPRVQFGRSNRLLYRFIIHLHSNRTAVFDFQDLILSPQTSKSHSCRLPNRDPAFLMICVWWPRFWSKTRLPLHPKSHKRNQKIRRGPHGC